MSNAEASSSRPKHSKKEHKKDKSSSKTRHHHHGEKKHREHKKRTSSEDGPFEHRVQRMRMSIPPKYAVDWMEGVKEALDGMLMRYVPQMTGVLLAHWEHEICDDTVKIINECPYGVAEVQFHAIVWSPKIGQVLYGTHSLSSPSHLSLLFAKTFNVSIPLQHIPLDTYEFEHTDAPEDEEAESSDDEDDEDLLGPGHGAVHEVGRWKELAGEGKVLGAAGERVKFTVIGLQVTNQMLSLTGSLLADPSNPPALPASLTTVARSPSPDLPEPPAKQARTSAPAKKAAAPAAPAFEVPEVDTSNMTERELKAWRKEQARMKRDARKERKAGAAGEEGEDEAAGSKRKAEDEGEGGRKKHKSD